MLRDNLCRHTIRYDHCDWSHVDHVTVWPCSWVYFRIRSDYPGLVQYRVTYWYCCSPICFAICLANLRHIKTPQR
ncbi:uncharacterized protein UV8b_05026 [Ustilaginoidea virens]|uniref:Uncharacterized protein n=1 Tax=Ustilaginoidea virens TaxID=1159556 RepID=A0A8E5HSF0_USTVR|nr:uncharacterized protein UV8b_05026 [Ustilaginoidea virens]QUC20785.1 hypothetical protein UV8b_05026 [Ustilaginoidea virens]